MIKSIECTAEPVQPQTGFDCIICGEFVETGFEHYVPHICNQCLKKLKKIVTMMKDDNDEG